MKFPINVLSVLNFAVLKVPGVKEKLGVPKIPVQPPAAPQSSFSLFPALKQVSSATSEPSSLRVEPSKVATQKISSSSVISQRLRSLEKQVKGKKKNKKR